MLRSTSTHNTLFLYVSFLSARTHDLPLVPTVHVSRGSSPCDVSMSIARSSAPVCWIFAFCAESLASKTHPSNCIYSSLVNQPCGRYLSLALCTLLLLHLLTSFTSAIFLFISMRTSKGFSLSFPCRLPPQSYHPCPSALTSCFAVWIIQVVAMVTRCLTSMATLPW